ncbi:Lysozyme [Liberibacter crescens BT-1]|uniref:Lysozyme n=1 Tax=Liberibacter crescens (strain BT-1) TaxID=1215343 RepID=L0EV46_LIBCB|nr:lysozyme [Liberibacter crescens]AGA64513.1 Lysozyme [Liberibacter crescens BT-1]AMC12668.1 hypothetical protein RL73_02700 [Liberibacter crescens]
MSGNSKNNFKTSQQGIDFIKEKEGFDAHVYKDTAGLPTIGYGHLIKPGEHFTTMTREQAEEFLKKELREAEAAVNSHVTVSLTQSQFDALVSFVYNLGCSAFYGSTLLHLVNEGQYEAAAEQFLRWGNDHRNGKLVPVAGLMKRRKEERLMFLGEVHEAA